MLLELHYTVVANKTLSYFDHGSAVAAASIPALEFYPTKSPDSIITVYYIQSNSDIQEGEEKNWNIKIVYTQEALKW